MYFGSALFSATLLGKLWGLKSRLAWALALMTVAWAINSSLLALYLLMDVGSVAEGWVLISRLVNSVLQLVCPLVVLITLDRNGGSK